MDKTRAYKSYTCECGESFVLTGGRMLWQYKIPTDGNNYIYYCSYGCKTKYAPKEEPKEAYRWKA